MPWQQWSMSGIGVYYHRCHRCQAIFTTAFDGFSTADFRQHVYNEGYGQVDPEYQGARPEASAQRVGALLGANRSLSVLDYGGGNGCLAHHLRLAGFTDVHTFDPFVPEHAAKPARRFRCITAFEVVEHSNHPYETFAEMVSMLDEEGLIMFSTLLQPRDIEQRGMNWWYIAPRNGHLTLYSSDSLQAIAQKMGYTCCSCGDALHAMFRARVPAFAEHVIRL